MCVETFACFFLAATAAPARETVQQPMTPPLVSFKDSVVPVAQFLVVHVTNVDDNNTDEHFHADAGQDHSQHELVKSERVIFSSLIKRFTLSNHFNSFRANTISVLT